MGILKAVAFDLDGTLYPNYRLYRRLFPQFLLHPVLYTAFMKVRRKLHANKEENTGLPSSFYDKQAFLLAACLKKDKEKARQKLDRLVYGSWEKLFSGIKLFPFVKETLAAFRNAGFRLALLSDFPPAQKLMLMGLDSFFDAVISTEETGALKPSGVPFAALVHSLSLKPEEILYVGNSLDFDVGGSKSAGLRAALIRRGPLSTGHVPKNSPVKPDFIFRDYRQLQDYVLK